MLLSSGVKYSVLYRFFGFGELVDAFERLREGPMGKVLIGN